MEYDELEILKDFIEIPSENSGGSETEIVSYCAKIFEDLGIDYEIVSEKPDRPTIMAFTGDVTAGPKLIMQGHLDTKPAAHGGTELEDWRFPPFEAVQQGGNVYGLGACDTKGGAAAQLASFIHAAQTFELAGQLVWQGVADEEHGSRYGAEFLLSEGHLVADAAIVAEPTDGYPTLAQLGNCWVDVKIKGVAAHGGTPWKGIDAVEATSRLLEVMRAKVARREPDPRFPHHPMVRVGKIEGGGHAGTVASVCSMVTDIRVRPGETRQDYLDLWHESIGEVSAELDVQIELVEFAGGGCEAHEIKEEDDFAKLVIRSWEQSRKRPWAGEVFFGGSDARYFARVGTPTIVLGAGSLEMAHAPDEFAPIDDVRNVRILLDQIIENFFAVGGGQ